MNYKLKPGRSASRIGSGWGSGDNPGAGIVAYRIG